MDDLKAHYHCVRPSLSKRLAMLLVVASNQASLSPAWMMTPALVSSKKRSFGATLSKVMRMAKDWDAIIAQEEAESKASAGTVNSTSSIADQIAPDMWYNQRNCLRSSKTFAALKEANAPGADLYGVAPKKLLRKDEADELEEATFWFLGKVAHVSDVTLEQAVSRQWCLIQQHAANLRPMELFGCASSLEMDIWAAPLDSEIDSAYNRPDSKFQKMERDVEGAANIKNTFIGFQGEAYGPDEEGFRVWRSERTGRPTRPEIKGPADPAAAVSDDDDDGEYRTPTDEELARFAKATEGRDINEIYEEQERRKAAGEFI